MLNATCRAEYINSIVFYTVKLQSGKCYSAHKNDTERAKRMSKPRDPLHRDVCGRPEPLAVPHRYPHAKMGATQHSVAGFAETANWMKKQCSVTIHHDESAMGKETSIEWTHHTFNPWWGCVRVSAACDHCYAETWAKRLGEDVWGAKSKRRFFGDAHWKEPLKWDRDAKAQNIRRRVFCASMADVFENRNDLIPHRLRLLELIDATPHLDWLLLTKRIHLVRKQLPKGYELPSNVWLGATVENQTAAGKRLKYLLEFTTPSVRFLSCEPLLGPLDLREWLQFGPTGKRVDWVIAGGESGPGSRPMEPRWPEDC